MLLRCLAFLVVFSPNALAFDERAIGDQVLRSLYSSTERVDDPILLSAASRLLTPIHRASSLRDQRVSLVILQNPELNAFAAPGGVMGLHTGLFTLAQSSDQVASVVAHEVAHISQRHFSRRMSNNSKIQAAYLAGAIAAIAAGFAGDPTVGAAALTTTQAAAIDQALEYSREHEREADRVGLQLMSQAGFDTQGMADMFEVMQAGQRLSGQPLAYLSSHPLSSERVADTRARVERQISNNAVSPDEFSYWQQRATDSAAPDTLDQIEQQTAAYSRLRYQRLAAYWLDQGELTQAQNTLSEARLSYPSDYALNLFQARVYAQAQPHKAFEILEDVTRTHPFFAQPFLEAKELARQLNWQPEFYYYAGWAAQQTGHSDEAQKHWQQVAKMDSPLSAKAQALLRPES